MGIQFFISTSVNRIDLQALTLVGPTVTRLLLDPNVTRPPSCITTLQLTLNVTGLPSEKLLHTAAKA